jgi:acetylornithine deacetylase/succinyl-diaminopimelate desuccinylase-like protein
MDIDAIIQRDFEKRVEELKAWIRIPSISTLPEHAGDVRRAAEWARAYLEGMGFPKTEVIETDGLPLVYAEWLAHPGKPTLLFYGHCDVQPADPVEEWKSAPFEPEVRDGKIYARGANDNKGQSMCWMGGLQALLARDGTLPVNVKVLMECEEEAGGEAIAAYVAAQPEKLKCDAVVVVDTAMIAPEKPSMVISLRGITYNEVEVRGAERDLHSGVFGGVAPNPLHALALIIARLKDEDGVIHIPELEALIPPVTADEEAWWAKEEDSEAAILRSEMGVEHLHGEQDQPLMARRGLRPTLEVHGIKGGFVGEGAKTVIPAVASAKISLRVPPGVDALLVQDAFAKAVQRVAPKGYSVAVKPYHAGRGLNVPWDSDAMKLARKAMGEVYGKEPVPMREGASIPVCADFATHLEVPVLMIGFGLNDDDLHAPNEKYDLAQLEKGMRTIARFTEWFGG